MIELFNSLTKKELKEFEDFVNSPYFNKYKTLTKLFYHLKNKHPEVKKEDISIKVISLQIYSKVNISNERYRKLKSDFSILLLKYLKQAEIGSDTAAGRFALYYALKKKGDVKKCVKLINEIEDHSMPLLKKDKYYINRINLLGEKYEQSMNSFRQASGLMLEKIKNVQFYFLYESLSDMITFLINNRHRRHELLNDSLMYVQILDAVKNNRKEIFREHPLIVIYYYIVQMIFEFDDKYYDQLMKYYSLKKKNFNFELMLEYHLCCEIYLHMKIAANCGDERSNRAELFKIDRVAFKKDSYYEMYFRQGRNIEAYKFMFTVKNALSLGKVSWAENFVEKYSSRILPLQRDAIYKVSKAIISLVTKDYDSALEYLINVSLSQPICYVESKLLKLMVWIELNNTDLYKNELASFKKSIHRNPVIDDDLLAQFNILIGYLNSILKLKNEKERRINAEVSALRKKVFKEQHLYDYKFWILQKLDELDDLKEP